MLEALRSSPADDWRNSAPLRWHEFGEVEQLFFFLPRPLSLLDRWIEPLMPPGLALLCGLPHQ
eukprot:scaffold85690_cov29-Tisochrysis_lutea.AAC.4